MISLPYPKPIDIYIGLSYEILSPQYQANHPSHYGEWELWEALWDDVLILLQLEFARQNCKVIASQNIDPVTLKPTPPAAMTENLYMHYSHATYY